MKKVLYILVKKSVVLFFFFHVAIIYAQTVSLVPKDVYVGDEAEVRFSFDWAGTLFVENAETLIPIVTSTTIDESLQTDYTIKSMQLLPSQTGYTLSILFVPWKSGVLNIDSFDLATIFALNVNSLLIDIPEIHIKSILSQTEDRNIRSPSGPIIIPGTTYALIAIVVLLLIFCIFAIIVLTRINHIKTWLQSFFGKIWSSDNFKKASRELILISKMLDSIDQKVFATKLSGIIRTYLEGRFSHRFTAETTSSFFMIFNTLFAGTVSSNADDFLQDLYEICVRCDFLHYAGEEVEKAPLTRNEAESLIDRTRKAIIYFEKDSDSDDETGGEL